MIIKRDGKLWGSRRWDPSPAVVYCLETLGLSLADIDLVVWSHIDHVPAATLAERMREEGGLPFLERPNIVLSHHFAHACCAYYLSGFERAAILVADGAGGPISALLANCSGADRDALAAGAMGFLNLRPDAAPDDVRENDTFFRVASGGWEPLHKTAGYDPKSTLGAEYGGVSAVLFGDALDAGKTMGLSPYGTRLTGPLILGRTGEPSMAPAFTGVHPPERDRVEADIKAWRASGKPVFESPRACDFAATAQREIEDALLVYTHWLRQRSGETNLCLAGGVGLNCVANALVARESGVARVFIPPCPGDDGIAIGCALYGAARQGELLEPGGRCLFLGRSYPAVDVDALCRHGLTHVGVDGPVSDFVAAQLAEGAVVAWFQGGSEFGPRALGHRSFLADPRRPQMRDKVNKITKNREVFRPFAPVVREEAVSEYFRDVFPSWFMSFVARVRPEKAHLLGAVVHVDGTARYQVLRPSDNPELDRLLSAFAHRTGVPILLNTSFNRAGEPLVETPNEAARCAVAAEADLLVIDGVIFRPRRSSPIEDLS